MKVNSPSHFLTFLAAIGMAAGLLLALNIVFFDAPIHFHLLYADYPNSNRPGHLKGAAVGTLDLLVKTILALLLTTGGVWYALRLLKAEDINE